MKNESFSFAPIARLSLAAALLVAGCSAPETRRSVSQDSSTSIDTRVLTRVGKISPLEVGDGFIWGYYPGAGRKARMYEGYVKLPHREGRPSLALLTLFPDEEPAGTWVLHDGIGFDYDEVVKAYASPTVQGKPREQMFGWDAQGRRWFPSTSQPNTSANDEKFNYRDAVSRDKDLAWFTRFGCFDGREVAPVNEATGACEAGEIVFQQIPANHPPYVFLPYYSLSTQVTVYKLFNEDSSDPEARVAMRLVYAKDRHGERVIDDGEAMLSVYIASFKETLAGILASERL